MGTLMSVLNQLVKFPLCRLIPNSNNDSTNLNLFMLVEVLTSSILLWTPFNGCRMTKIAAQVGVTEAESTSLLNRMELLDISASAKLTWDKSAKVSELPLSNLLGSAIMAGFN